MLAKLIFWLLLPAGGSFCSHLPVSNKSNMTKANSKSEIGYRIVRTLQPHAQLLFYNFSIVIFSTESTLNGKQKITVL